MSKFTKILLYVLLIVSAVIIVLFYVQASSVNFGIGNIGNLLQSITMIDALIWATYVLIAITIIALVALSILGMVENPKTLKKTGFVVLLAAILIAISYFLASGDPIVVNIEKQPTTAMLKLTDTGLIMTYILFGVALISLCSGSIIKAIRNK